MSGEVEDCEVAGVVEDESIAFEISDESELEEGCNVEFGTRVAGEDSTDDEVVKLPAYFCMRNRLERPHVEQMISIRGCPFAKKFCTLETPGIRMLLQRLQMVRFTSGALELVHKE